jgi:hypothetical protein
MSGLFSLFCWWPEHHKSWYMTDLNSKDDALNMYFLQGNYKLPDHIHAVHVTSKKNPSSRIITLWSTHRLMSTRNLPGGKGQPVCKAYCCLWAECLENVGTLDVSQPSGPPRPGAGTALYLLQMSASEYYLLVNGLLCRLHSWHILTLDRLLVC